MKTMILFLPYNNLCDNFVNQVLIGNIIFIFNIHFNIIVKRKKEKKYQTVDMTFIFLAGPNISQNCLHIASPKPFPLFNICLENVIYHNHNSKINISAE